MTRTSPGSWRCCWRPSWAPSRYRVTVRDGIVRLTGSADPTTRRLASLLAREVPGVIEVRFGEE